MSVLFQSSILEIGSEKRSRKGRLGGEVGWGLEQGEGGGGKLSKVSSLAICECLLNCIIDGQLKRASCKMESWSYQSSRTVLGNPCKRGVQN